MLLRLARFLLVIVGAVVSSALGLLLARQVLSVGANHDGAACPVLCAGGVLILWAPIAAHEFGHLVAGWAMGLPFMCFSVGPLQVVREVRRLRVRLNTAWLAELNTF